VRIRVCLIVLLTLVASSERVLAQNWSFDARTIALGGVGGSGNLATNMIDEQRDYTSIVLPFGLFQVLKDFNTFDPNSRGFDPVRAIDYAASPIHYVIGRDTSNSSEAFFVSDIRNATLNRDLTSYHGFVPANDILIEGLVAPNFGHTFKLHKNRSGGFQGIYIGAGPYLSMHSSANIDRGLTGVLATGVNVRNAQFPMTSASEGQLALAVTGGYRGRFGWPAGVGSGSAREGLYVAANYNYLHGFQYENIDMTIRLDTDNSGLLTVAPSTTPLVIDRREATGGTGFAIDFGVGAVIDHWEVGFGANGIANRIDWNGLTQTRYSLNSLLSGNSNFTETANVAVADTRVELPVDYRANVSYVADLWSATVEGGQGFAGASFRGGLERRFNRIELRGGARYTVEKWNPTGGIGFDLSRHVSVDVAAFGTNANIERKRRTAIAASIRFNHFQ
jgi:hypothetical protein